MWHFMCDALIKAIGTEPDSDVLSEIMHAFAKVLSAWFSQHALWVSEPQLLLKVNLFSVH